MSGAEPVAPAESPGRILRSAREAMGLSRREIAEALNLLESVVVAIEEDDTARQPEPVFMRGYVRNYARLLKLDPEPLIGALSSVRSSAPARTVQTLPESPRWIWPSVGVALALAVLGGVVFHLLDPGPDDSSTEAAGIAAMGGEAGEALTGAAAAGLEPLSEDIADQLTATPATAPEPSEALIEVDNDDGPAENPDLSVSPGASGEAEVIPPSGLASGTPESLGLPVLQPGATPTEPMPESVAGETLPGVVKKRLNRGNRDTIRIQFSADCWVRVKDATGRMLFSDMGRPGVEMELTGGGPFDLLLGFAPAATLEWNGEKVALEPHMRNNVATLVLDRDAIGQESTRDEPAGESAANPVQEAEG